MFSIDKFTKDIIIVIGTGLIGYEKLMHPISDDEYIPPTEEDIIYAYRNIPIFNRTVDTITAYISHLVEKEIDHAWRGGHIEDSMNMKAQINKKGI